MPQRDLVMPWRDALGNASIALENAGVGRSAARDRARELFARFDLGTFERARSWELSGGMRQRVAFMRTLLAEKPLLLLDEPFASLDAITRIELQDWLVEALAQEPRTVVMVTHDIEEALVVCERVIVLSARPGRRVMETPAGSRATRPSSARCAPRCWRRCDETVRLGARAARGASSLWQAWVDLRDVPDYLLPAPTDVASTLWDERSSLLTDALHTFGEMLAGFALAIVSGWAPRRCCTAGRRFGARSIRS